MDLGPSKESGYNLTDEEDCSQDDDVSDGGRRRRFCNERAKQHHQHHNNKLQQIKKSTTDPGSGPSQSNSSSSNKRQKLNESSRTSASLSSQYHPPHPKQTNRAALSMGPRLPYSLARPARLQRRPIMPYGIRLKPPPPPTRHSNDNQHCTTKKVFNTASQLVSHDTVIFVNPIFIKKFLMKAMIMMHPPDVDSKPQATTGMPVDSFSFQESPADALQAAATMAIIRLVTECIEDDSKRDEKSNKVLANRLMLQMKAFSQRTEPNTIQYCHGPDLEPKLSPATP